MKGEPKGGTAGLGECPGGLTTWFGMLLRGVPREVGGNKV